MDLLRCIDQTERALIVPPTERLPRRLTQPPRLRRQAHERPEIRPAARAHTRAAEARLADRAVVDHDRSALSLDEEEQLFERPRGFL